MTNEAFDNFYSLVYDMNMRLIVTTLTMSYSRPNTRR